VAVLEEDDDRRDVVAAAVGGLVGPSRRLLNEVSGVAMIAMGLLVLEVVRLPFLYQERKIHLRGILFRFAETSYC